MIEEDSEDYDAFVASSEAFLSASRSVPSIKPLEESGWMDLLGVADAESTEWYALYSVFEAGGRCLATAPALSCLFASDWMGTALQPDRAPCLAAFPTDLDTRGGLVLAAPTAPTEQWIIDVPARGVFLAAASDGQALGASVFDSSLFEAVTIDDRALVETIPEQRAREVRDRVVARSRLAIAFDLLGSAEVMLNEAAMYASLREQFGKRLASFETIRTLLASASSEIVALRSACFAVLDSKFGADPESAGIYVKLIASRTANTVAQIAQQIFGAISFTWEHEHHRYHRRVLTFDSLLGDQAALAVQIGQQVRTSRRVPRVFSLIPDQRSPS